eukprot:TRINITY_DN5182_c0_g1_i2.p1 TRINITY_DN5182_c0_g1~~TRINITY_DN5182_c0_g1_i2.p1  ORF type:complete len:220 (-),score=39.45 TRINITY_DN5182_c0_g1_i2:62-721(-)
MVQIYLQTNKWRGSKKNFSSGKASWTMIGDNETFYEYRLDVAKNRWNCEKGLKRTIPNLRLGYVHWVQKDNFLEVEDGSDWKEGSSMKWEISGDMKPTHPAALFVVMFTRSNKLRDEEIERSKRVYKRCGKLVLASAGPTLLCSGCASGNGKEQCIVCDQDCAGKKFQGKICKTCAPRKNFCIKCSDPLFGSKVEGFLCNSCGLGKQSDNCAKMVFTIK